MNIIVSRSSKGIKVLNNGSGNFDGDKLTIAEADIKICGSGNVSIHVEDELQS